MTTEATLERFREAGYRAGLEAAARVVIELDQAIADRNQARRASFDVGMIERLTGFGCARAIRDLLKRPPPP